MTRCQLCKVVVLDRFVFTLAAISDRLSLFRTSSSTRPSASIRASSSEWQLIVCTKLKYFSCCISLSSSSRVCLKSSIAGKVLFTSLSALTPLFISYFASAAPSLTISSVPSPPFSTGPIRILFLFNCILFAV